MNRLRDQEFTLVPEKQFGCLSAFIVNNLLNLAQSLIKFNSTTFQVLKK